MRLRPFVITFILLWVLSAGLTLWHGDFAKAANFGDSFGAINALFSGVALALAIYSMILQQRQNAEFEQKTLAAMTQQAETIRLVQQANVARVTALTYLIEREEQRIETLKEWGMQSYKDENYYSKGIKAAKTRIDVYQAQIEEVGTAVC
jgi:type II secretory pathway pseudopilin PulG